MRWAINDGWDGGMDDEIGSVKDKRKNYACCGVCVCECLCVCVWENRQRTHAPSRMSVYLHESSNRNNTTKYQNQQQ